jgi:hypothetical protein
MGLSSEYLFKKKLMQAIVQPNKSVAVQMVKMLTFKPRMSQPTVS